MSASHEQNSGDQQDIHPIEVAATTVGDGRVTVTDQSAAGCRHGQGRRRRFQIASGRTGHEGVGRNAGRINTVRGTHDAEGDNTAPIGRNIRSG